MSEQTAPDRRNRVETEAEAADRLLHRSSFGTAAAAYAEHRPGYAEAAVRWALGLQAGRRDISRGLKVEMNTKCVT